MDVPLVHSTDRSRSAAATKKRKTDPPLADLTQSKKPRKPSKPNRKTHKKTKRKTLTEGEGLRRWVFSPRDCSHFKDKFVIVSYNILGVENASKHLDLYRGVSPRLLNWERRKRVIRKEIRRYNPSVLCFQEVDRFADLAQLLKEDGFIGVYKARTGDACDGCAIFWKGDIFTLLHQENIEFQQFDLRNNVAQFCILKMNANRSSIDGHNQDSGFQPTRSLLVGNTHMLFNPNRGDIKLGQVRLFIQRAYKISKEWGSIPVVFAGDFNSTPKSAIYEFLASSELNILVHDRRQISGQVESSASCGTFTASSGDPNRSSTFRWSNEELYLAAGCIAVTHLRHHLHISSAYAGVPGSSSTRDGSGEPLATSHHSKFMGTVDYIWHSKELVPVRVVETLPIDILRKIGGLPSKKWGSDHLSLVCELAFDDSIGA